MPEVRKNKQGRTLCPHNKTKQTCKECKGAGICDCGKIKYYCRKCKGGGFCIHDKQKRCCRECVGTYICEHNRRKPYCKQCGGLPVAVKEIYWSAKRRSREENVPFNITKEYVLKLVGDGVCPVLGIKYDLTSSKPVNASMTLDKIIPSLGYIIGNCAIISRLANTIKSNATSEQVQRVADWMKINGA